MNTENAYTVALLLFIFEFKTHKDQRMYGIYFGTKAHLFALHLRKCYNLQRSTNVRKKSHQDSVAKLEKCCLLRLVIVERAN